MTEEYLNVANEIYEAIGGEVRRNSGLRHRGVNGLLFTPDHRLMVKMRSHTRNIFPGTLHRSVFENLTPGESFLSATVGVLWEKLIFEPLLSLVRFNSR